MRKGKKDERKETIVFCLISKACPIIYNSLLTVDASRD